MYTKMENIKRVDFDTYVCNSDEKPVALTGHKSVIYNTDVISDKEVEKLINTGMYNSDPRVITVTQEQADNLKGPTRPVINAYRYRGDDITGVVFAESEESAWKILKEQYSKKVYKRIHSITLFLDNIKNGTFIEGLKGEKL